MLRRLYSHKAQALRVRFGPRGRARCGHLTWSTHSLAFLDDRLPMPYTTEALTRVWAHIDETQEALSRRRIRRRISFAGSTFSELDFIAEIVRRMMCGPPLDVNNVHVASTNGNRYPISTNFRWLMCRTFMSPTMGVNSMGKAGRSSSTAMTGRSPMSSVACFTMPSHCSGPRDADRVERKGAGFDRAPGRSQSCRDNHARGMSKGSSSCHV
ncbi:DUF692 family protein [bacterium]|nr:MAG: DUF692 family protein [bacterium]